MVNCLILKEILIIVRFTTNKMELEEKNRREHQISLLVQVKTFLKEMIKRVRHTYDSSEIVEHAAVHD